MRIIILGLLIFYSLKIVSGKDVNFRGQSSVWAAYSDAGSTLQQYGIRYIPEFSTVHSLGDNTFFDGEVSVNAFHAGVFEKFEYLSSESKIKLYRLWLRYAATQYEIRAGLQKINFGPAVIFRSLMWFDAIDPRDPLKITDGVYALLGRYYFLDNTNLWIWALYGNTATKGWEFNITSKGTMEYGGRIQWPLFSGETAISYHHRTARLKTLAETLPYPIEEEAPENRIALDGRWDIEVGVWLEVALLKQEHTLLPLPWGRSFTVGLDYTFDWGNGLTILSEYFTLLRSEKIFSRGEGFRFSAFSATYPLDIIDQLHAILYYDWDNRDIYSFYNWQIRYDNWALNLMAFNNPETYQLYPNQPGNILFSGRGVQILVSFNH